MKYMRILEGLLAAVVCLWSAGDLSASPVLDPTAPNNLALYTLGNAPSILAQYSNPVTYQGIAITSDNLLVAVGNGASAVQTVWSLPLIRNNGHITAFGNPSAYAQVMASDPNTVGNIVSGGLVPTAEGLLYTTIGYSYLGQYTSVNQTSGLLDLNAAGAFTGGLQYVPNGFSGAGQLKASSLTGEWFTLHPQGNFGSYFLGGYTADFVGISAYSFEYAPVDTAFSQASIILGDANTQRLDAYGIDPQGNPCVIAGCAPVVHLVTNDLAVGYGIVRDSRTGDILFTTQQNEIWVLSDDLPEPSTWMLGLGGLGVLAGLDYRRRVMRRRKTSSAI